MTTTVAPALTIAAQEGDPTPATRMAYWKPAPALEGLVSGYHLYAVAPPHGTLHRDVFQPGWFNLRVLRDPQTCWTVHQWADAPRRVPDVALFGPTSAATWSASDAGAVVGAGITPLGWTRLGLGQASTFADRIVPAATVFGPLVEYLAARLRNAADEELPEILDRWLIDAMREPSRNEWRVARLAQALLDPAHRSVAGLATATGMSQRMVERLSLSAFGFTPKLLLRRARFLRSLHRLIRGGRGRRALAIDAGYSDYSHFVREAHEFLGMAPTRFLSESAPMFGQSLLLRQAVLGAPAQALARS